jgi:hypothetical protein
LEGQAPSRPEIEIACVPGATRFSGRAEFNVLVVLELGPQIIPLARQAQLVISDLELPGVDRGRLRRLSSMRQALQDAA